MDYGRFREAVQRRLADGKATPLHGRDALARLDERDMRDAYRRAMAARAGGADPVAAAVADLGTTADVRQANESLPGRPFDRAGREFGRRGGAWAAPLARGRA